jgi:hypothetical protein
MKDTISYGPSRVPAGSAMGTCGVYQVAVQGLAEARGSALLGGQVQQCDVFVPSLAERVTVDLNGDDAGRFDLRILFDVIDPRRYRRVKVQAMSPGPHPETSDAGRPLP